MPTAPTPPAQLALQAKVWDALDKRYWRTTSQVARWAHATPAAVLAEFQRLSGLGLVSLIGSGNNTSAKLK